MRLTAKLLLFLIAGAVVVLAVDGYLSVRREIDFFEQELRQEAELLGLGLGQATAELWRSGGRREVDRLLAEVNRDENVLNVRWVWLDGEGAEEDRPLVSREALDIIQEGSSLTLAGRDRLGRRVLITYAPVQVPSGRRGALELAQAYRRIREYTHSTAIRVVILTMTMISVSAILAALFGVLLVGRPLHLLAEKTKRIGRGDLSGPLRLPGHDELTDLSAAMNLMCERLEASREKLMRETEAKLAALEQLRHDDRLRTVGRLASSIAHEIGTPLNVISGRAELILSEDASAGEGRESARIIRTQCVRITETVRRLLDFSRRPSPEKWNIDLPAIARKTLDLLAPLALRKNVSLRLVDESGTAPLRADPGQIEQVVTNLVMNAIQAMPAAGEVVVRVFDARLRAMSDPEGPERDFRCVSVRDEGEGIREEDRPHLFEPFFTTKDVGEGTGLGLSIVYGIVSEHAGWIDVESEPGRGSSFTVHLPGGGDA